MTLRKSSVHQNQREDDIKTVCVLLVDKLAYRFRPRSVYSTVDESYSSLRKMRTLVFPRLFQKDHASYQTMKLPCMSEKEVRIQLKSMNLSTENDT